MTAARHRTGNRLDVDTDRDAPDDEQPQKPTMLRQIVMACIGSLLGGVVTAIVSFVALQQNVGALIARMDSVTASVNELEREVRSNTNRIVSLEADRPNVAAMQVQIATLVRESAEHGATLRVVLELVRGMRADNVSPQRGSP